MSRTCERAARRPRSIWAGERDAGALTAPVDPNSARLLRRVLELLERPGTEGAEA
jgi:hypothetical protein